MKNSKNVIAFIALTSLLFVAGCTEKTVETNGAPKRETAAELNKRFVGSDIPNTPEARKQIREKGYYTPPASSK